MKITDEETAEEEGSESYSCDQSNLQYLCLQLMITMMTMTRNKQNITMMMMTRSPAENDAVNLIPRIKQARNVCSPAHKTIQ